MEKRIDSIDLLKCIAIFFVVSYHNILFPTNYLYENSFQCHLGNWIKSFFASGVPLFFFANGFLMFGKEFDLNKHIKKILKYVVLTFFWAIITTLLTLLFYGENIEPIKFFYSVTSLELGYSNHLWYLGALVAIYIFFPCLKTSFDNNKKAFYFFTIACATLTLGKNLFCYIVSIGAHIVKNSNTPFFYDILNKFNPFTDVILQLSLIHFCIGGIFQKITPTIEKIEQRKRNLLGAIIFLFSDLHLVLMGYFYSFTMNDLWDIVSNSYSNIYVCICAVCIFILCLSYKNGGGGYKQGYKLYISKYIRNIFSSYYNNQITDISKYYT